MLNLCAVLLRPTTASSCTHAPSTDGMIRPARAVLELVLCGAGTSTRRCWNRRRAVMELARGDAGSAVAWCWSQHAGMLEPVTCGAGTSARRCWERRPRVLESVSQARRNVATSHGDCWTWCPRLLESAFFLVDDHGDRGGSQRFFSMFFSATAECKTITRVMRCWKGALGDGTGR